MSCWLGEGVGPGNPGRRGPLEVEGSQAPLRQAGHRPRKAETAQTSEQETLLHLQAEDPRPEGGGGPPRNQESS